MNGAEALLRTAARAGVEVCFSNPGTTEISLVAALDTVSGVRAVLGLFEGVCTGAADGYARMTGKPALTLLHLGPGFANGIANLHNARRARVPVVNLIGDQATWHLKADAPLTTDIVSLAVPVSDWVWRTKAPDDLATDVANAIAASMSAGGQVATLVVPADCAWRDAPGPASPRRPDPPRVVEPSRVDAVAEALGGGARSALLLAGTGTGERGLGAAGRIAAKTGCTLLCDTFPTRVERGAGRPRVQKVAYFPEQGREQLGHFDHLILAGTRSPVAFFGYPGHSSSLVPEGVHVHELARPEEDVVAALEDLVDALGAPVAPTAAELHVPDPPRGPLNPQTLGLAVACVQPEGAIVMDEAATSGLPYSLVSDTCPPHTYLGLTGGAIGQGLPCASGAALACPDRPVIALQADGSGAYTVQALWTQAREGLDVKTVICSNRAYRILQVELGRAGIAEPGPKARALTQLTEPTLDWVAVARGFGVPGVRVETAEDLTRALERALAEPGPALIEALL